MKNNKRVLFTVMILLFLISAILSICLGAVSISLPDLWKALVSGPDHTAGYIFWYVRLPRTAACLLAGAALSASGCILQSVLENKLASPNIIGVNAGAGLGITAACALGFLGGWAFSLFAFLGAVIAALLILLLAKRTGASRTTVILAGVAMNSILTAFRDALSALIPDAAIMSSEFRVGGFSSVSTSRLIPAGIIIVVSLLILTFFLNELDLLALGEDTAKSLGLRTGLMRTAFLGLAALLAAGAVSFSGLLGFVGLLIPHLARMLVGNESRHLLPFSMLLGAVFVTLSDVLTRVIFAPHEFYVGILISMIGGPFFLFLLLRRKGGRDNA